jgi:hypothetical protein
MGLCCISASAIDDPISNLMEKRGMPIEGVNLTIKLQKNAIISGDTDAIEFFYEQCRN